MAADTFEARCIERLSVARRFDCAAFAHVVTTFGTALPLDRFDRLADLSFVTRTDNGFLSLHNVVAEAIRETLSDEKRRTSLAALFEHFSSRAKVRSHREVTEANVTALFEAAYLRQAQGLDGNLALLLRAQGDLAGARPLSERALAIAEKALGAEHPQTATSLNNLANLLQAQGDLAGRGRSPSGRWRSMRRRWERSIPLQRPSVKI